MKKRTLALDTVSFVSTSNVRLSDRQATRLKDPERASLTLKEKMRAKLRLKKLQQDVDLEDSKDQLAVLKTATEIEKSDQTISAYVFKEAGKGKPASKFPKKGEKSADEAEEKPEKDDVDSAVDDLLGGDDSEPSEEKDDSEEAEEETEESGDSDSEESDEFEEV